MTDNGSLIIYDGDRLCAVINLVAVSSPRESISSTLPSEARRTRAMISILTWCSYRGVARIRLGKRCCDRLLDLTSDGNIGSFRCLQRSTAGNAATHAFGAHLDYSQTRFEITVLRALLLVIALGGTGDHLASMSLLYGAVSCTVQPIVKTPVRMLRIREPRLQ